MPRMLQASGTVPIRVWVEYQGTSSLSEEGKQRLYDTVNVALGVLQKFFKVGNAPATTSRTQLSSPAQGGPPLPRQLITAVSLRRALF